MENHKKPATGKTGSAPHTHRALVSSCCSEPAAWASYFSRPPARSASGPLGPRGPIILGPRAHPGGPRAPWEGRLRRPWGPRGAFGAPGDPGAPSGPLGRAPSAPLGGPRGPFGAPGEGAFGAPGGGGPRGALRGSWGLWERLIEPYSKPVPNAQVASSWAALRTKNVEKRKQAAPEA